MQAEARIARKLGWPVAVGGGRPEGAARAAEELVAQGVKALVSFGLAGGLDPVLFPGDVLVPYAVADGDERLACDVALMQRLGGGTRHVMLAARDIVPTALEKRALCRATGAHAVDLESGAVARVALAHGLPFAVLRAICDPANCSLPPAAIVALNRKGAIGFGRVLLSVLRFPRQIRDLRELAADAHIARDALLERIKHITGA
jgi:adenosylhomocysteine nucleosidase